MGNRGRKEKGRLPPFTAMINHTTQSAAWLALSHGARSLFNALKYHYNRKTESAVYLSTRRACEQLGSFSSRSAVQRWFKELECYGFIVQITPGYLGVGGKGKAPHWRITDERYHGEAPTRDFEKWDGVLYEEFKQKPPSHYKKLDFLRQHREAKNRIPAQRVVHDGPTGSPLAGQAEVKNPKTVPTGSP